MNKNYYLLVIVIISVFFTQQVLCQDEEPKVRIDKGHNLYNPKMFGYLKNKLIRPIDTGIIFRNSIENRKDVKNKRESPIYVYFIGDKQNIEYEQQQVDILAEISQKFDDKTKFRFAYSKSGLEGGAKLLNDYIKQEKIPFVFIYDSEQKKYLKFEGDLTKDSESLQQILQTLDKQDFIEIEINNEQLQEIHQADMKLRRKYQEARKNMEQKGKRNEKINDILTEEEIKELKQKREQRKNQKKMDPTKLSEEQKKRREEIKKRAEERRKQHKQEDL